MFTGFQIQVPEIAVPLPQSGKTYRIRSLRLGEEASTKSSLFGSALPIVNKLNQLVYQSIMDEDKPSFEDFLRTTSTKDRDALVLGLYQVTYGNEYTMNDYTCSNPQCGQKYSLKTYLSDGLVMERFETGDLMSIKKDIQLEDNLFAVIKQASLEDEVAIMKATDENDKMLDFYLKIDKFKYSDKDNNTLELSLLDKTIDFIVGCNQLLPRHKKLVNTTYAENFGKFGVRVDVAYTCPHCGQDEKFVLDFVKQFFLLVCGLE